MFVVLRMLVRCACSRDLPPLLIAFDRFVGVSAVRLGVLGGCRVTGLDFDEFRAGLSSSYVAALLFVAGADHPARCFVIARALCLLQRSPSTPHRVRSVRGFVVCSLGFVGLLVGQGAGALGCAHARCSRAERPCCVFSRLLRSPATPPWVLVHCGARCREPKAHLFTKNLVLCGLFEVAAGVTTRAGIPGFAHGGAEK